MYTITEAEETVTMKKKKEKRQNKNVFDRLVQKNLGWGMKK
jgi:hypothetical protein